MMRVFSRNNNEGQHLRAAMPIPQPPKNTKGSLKPLEVTGPDIVPHLPATCPQFECRRLTLYHSRSPYHAFGIRIGNCLPDSPSYCCTTVLSDNFAGVADIPSGAVYFTNQPHCPHHLCLLRLKCVIYDPYVLETHLEDAKDLILICGGEGTIMVLALQYY
jgi:hypothetical protein